MSIPSTCRLDVSIKCKHIDNLYRSKQLGRQCRSLTRSIFHLHSVIDCPGRIGIPIGFLLAHGENLRHLTVPK